MLPDYDTESLLGRTRKALLTLASDMTSFESTFGRKEVHRPDFPPGRDGRWLGWTAGRRATYVGVAPGLPVGEYELTVGPDVPVDGFWSISVYNADGFFEPNERGAYSVNNITARHNDDGSITVRFGGDGDPERNSCPSPTAGTTSSGSTGHAPRSSTARGASPASRK